MRNGFFTALGTPFDEFGNFLPKSFKRHIADQIEAGASALLVMGSMGIEPCIKQTEYTKVAKVSLESVNGLCPVLVGVMDNSITRVKDRIDSLRGLKVDGVVATIPYYYAPSQEDIKTFFRKIAQISPFPLYLYDLPVVTKVKISMETVVSLMCEENIIGIKTGDIVLARALMQSPEKKDNFSVIFSGLDVFDIAYKYGIKMNLDGMFSCTPTLVSRMYKSLENEDYVNAAKYLNSIITLRDTLLEVGVFRGFTHAMNLLGYEGIFAPDYLFKADNGEVEKVRLCMRNCDLI